MSFSRFYVELNADLAWRLFLLFAAIGVIMASSDAVFATNSADNDVIGQTLCRLVANLSGGVARGIATISIFSLGVGLS